MKIKRVALKPGADAMTLWNRPKHSPEKFFLISFNERLLHDSQTCLLLNMLTCEITHL